MRSALFLFVISSTLVFGQTELSVDQAIQKTLENNYQVQLVRANVEVAETQNSWGMAGLSPTFSLNLTNSTNLTDNSNNPASFFPGLVLVDNFSPSIDMNWTLFRGFGIRISKDRYEQLEDQTKGNAIVVIENTVYDVIMAYYTAVVQERKLVISREMLNFSTGKLAYYEMKSEMGVGTSIDALEFKNLMLQDSTNVLTQEMALKNALRNLNMIMGEDVESEYRLTDSLEFDVPHITYGELKNFMMQNNQNLKNQYINVALQELNKDAQKSAFYPVVSLNLGAAPSFGYIELFGDDGFSTRTNSPGYYGTISAKYDLFNGFQRKRNLEVAKIQTEIANLELEELKLNMSHNLKNIFDQYQLNSKIEDVSLRRVFHAQTMWNYGKEQYDAAKINIFGLNDIRLSYLQARLTYYDRLFDLLKTHYDLYRLTGKLAQEYKASDKVDR